MTRAKRLPKILTSRAAQTHPSLHSSHAKRHDWPGVDAALMIEWMLTTTAEFRRKFCGKVPMRRMAEPGDLEGPLLFLVSDAARYVTGIELRVDGGFTAL